MLYYVSKLLFIDSFLIESLIVVVVILLAVQQPKKQFNKRKKNNKKRSDFDDVRWNGYITLHGDLTMD